MFSLAELKSGKILHYTLSLLRLKIHLPISFVNVFVFVFVRANQLSKQIKLSLSEQIKLMTHDISVCFGLPVKVQLRPIG